MIRPALNTNLLGTPFPCLEHRIKRRVEQMVGIVADRLYCQSQEYFQYLLFGVTRIEKP